MKTNEVSSREYHARRQAKKQRQREQLRQMWLARVRAAIRHLAPRYPEMEAVYLFGSIMQPGRFTPYSDIDVAVAATTVAVESAFWRALEEELERDVDVRPYQPPITLAIADYGECVYARTSDHSGTEHSQ
ncbi:MAG: nucleotidyltransferase family protein [Anaerolineae bacterium]